jgi:hypothetical protein
MRAILFRPVVVVAASLMLARAAAGSCGQAACTVDSRLSAQPLNTAGQLRLDLQMEYIEQDQPWVGFHSAEVGAIERPDHQEVSTTNMAWKLGTQWAVTERWAVWFMLPIVHREHFHLAVPEDEDGTDSASGHGGGAHSSEPASSGEVTIGDATGIPERWNFTNIGDIQLTTRYAVVPQSTPTDWGLQAFAGLKLPTGVTNERNGDGEKAEITLQPGTGSVDPIVGLNLLRGFSVPTLRGDTGIMPSFAGALLRTPGSDGTYGYRPGTELLVNLGVSYPLVSRLSAWGQLNFRYKDSDHVGNAPGVDKGFTGGEYLYVTPGLELELADRLHALALVQVPVMQRVNGIQLTSWWNLLFGVAYELDL